MPDIAKENPATNSSSTPLLDRTATLARIVAVNGAAARVFQKHRLDFCCHGEQTVDQACAAAGKNPETIWLDLDAAARKGDGAPYEDPTGLSTPALVARIVDRHHGYLRRSVPVLGPLAAKVAGVHGDHNPKLRELRDVFGELVDEIGPHLEFEEETAFPALTARDVQRTAADAERLRREHVAVGALLERIRKLSDDYSVPSWGCGSYRMLMNELEALETDLLAHIHLENHVLLPRAKEAAT